MNQLRELLADWYRELDTIDKVKVVAMLARGEYGEVVDEYKTSPGFPTNEMVMAIVRFGPYARCGW